MGFMAVIKAQKAYNQQSKGNVAEAKKLYEEAIAGGLDQARFLLAYATLLIRSGDFAKARELLVKTQKAPGITAEQKTQLFVNYAACVYKMGEINKGVGILERQHIKQPSGLVYQTLGYLYVEKLKDGPAAIPAPEKEEAPEATEEGEAITPETPALSPEEAWKQQVDKALAFCKEAADYDEEDAICMDNLAQFYYRVLGDRENAKIWFDKAIAQRPGQIDTLWFLSRYDLEKGDTASAVQKLKKMLDGRFSPLNYATPDMVRAELARLGAGAEE